MPSRRALNEQQQDKQGEEYFRARSARACERLLDLLCRHHPDECPPAVVAYEVKLLQYDDQPEPTKPPTQDEIEAARLAAWVERQKIIHRPSAPPHPPCERRIEVREIQDAVCKDFGIARTELLSHRRGRNISHPRQIGFYLSRELTLLSLPQIGMHFGGRDHTTILHGITLVEKKMAADASLKDRIERIRARV